jgi:hypothetical protein
MPKAIVRQKFDQMPQGAAIGSEIDLDENTIAQLERDGYVERSAASDDRNQQQQQQKQSREATNPVAAVGTQNFNRDQNRPTAQDSTRDAMKPGDRSANEALTANRSKTTSNR